MRETFRGGQVKAINSKVTENSDSIQETRIDYEKLFHAVSVAESSGCTSSVARRTNNCVSIMGWKNGKRFIRKFATIEDNKLAFISLWKRVYKRLPDLALARIYTGGDSPSTWLKTVHQHYYEKK